MSRKYGFIGSEAIQLGKFLFLRAITPGKQSTDVVFNNIKDTFYGHRKYPKNGREHLTRFLLKLKKRYGIYYENGMVCFEYEVEVNTQLKIAAYKYYDKLVSRHTYKRHIRPKRGRPVLVKNSGIKNKRLLAFKG